MRRSASSTGGVFYGWTIVAVLVVFSAMAVGLAGPNIAIFIEPMTRDLGWSPATFGWAQMARLQAVIVAGPVIGRALDRFGPRPLVATAGVLTSGLVVSLAYVQDEWQLIALFFVTGLLGMGRAADLFVSAPVAKWFVRRRGLAMGIALAGTPLGVAIFYPLSQLTIDSIGWRDAWLVFGIAGVVIIGPLSILFLRRQPEDMGLRPDGDRGDTADPISTGETEVSWTRTEAVRSARFWVLIAGFTLFTYGWATITIFRVSAFRRTRSRPDAGRVRHRCRCCRRHRRERLPGQAQRAGPATLSDSARHRELMVSAGSLIVVDSVPLLFVANIGSGFGFQTGHVAQNLMWADYYGRAHLGEIRGLSLPLTVGIGATAFPIIGMMRDSFGYYTPAWVAAMVVLAMAAIALANVRPPAKQHR